jgi:DNA-binding NarL/FixJ family response regulator
MVGLSTLIRILVVEQPATVRRTLCARLLVETDMAVVGEAEDVASAIGIAHERHPQVILLDAEMPHIDLPEAVRVCCAEAPLSAVVVLTFHTTAVARALGGAVATVVGKHEGTAALVAAIRRAASDCQQD